MSDITAREDIITTEEEVITHRNNTKDDIKIKCDITTKDNVTSDDSTRNKVSKSEMIASLKSLARRSDSLLISDLLATQSRDSGWSCDPCPRPQRCVCSDSTALTEAAAISGGQLTNYLVDDLIRHVATCVRSDGQVSQ
ncbi:uncharacterized protein LOC120356518 [Nilaparvata lugens]|uniref:uncharacterized protein LOC120356518 n=1 Tax=Nilaparvata lugens TaxID=108931 RepID=UPI00193DB2E0|nr:uncharacterized protein LOC120356518 [Nilaparvata lugens]